MKTKNQSSINLNRKRKEEKTKEKRSWHHTKSDAQAAHAAGKGGERERGGFSMTASLTWSVCPY